VEEYVLDALTASVEQVVPGLGQLAGMLAVLAGELAGPDPVVKTLDAMEQLVTVRGRELLRAVLQYGLDARAGAEVRLPEVTGADGVTRTRAGRDHARKIVTTLGTVRVRRIGYRAGAKGVPCLFPQDAVLNLPPRGYSWQLQQLAVTFTRSGAYEQAREFIEAATGVTIGKKQLEQITAEAAADAPGFYPALAREQDQGQEGQQQQQQEEEEEEEDNGDDENNEDEEEDGDRDYRQQEVDNIAAAQTAKGVGIPSRRIKVHCWLSDKDCLLPKSLFRARSRRHREP
jgi:hypothetical protein